MTITSADNMTSVKKTSVDVGVGFWEFQQLLEVDVRRLGIKILTRRCKVRKHLSQSAGAIASHQFLFALIKTRRISSISMYWSQSCAVRRSFIFSFSALTLSVRINSASSKDKSGVAAGVRLPSISSKTLWLSSGLGGSHHQSRPGAQPHYHHRTQHLDNHGCRFLDHHGIQLEDTR